MKGKARIIKHSLDDMYVVEHRNCPDGPPETKEYLSSVLLHPEKGVGKQWNVIGNAILFPSAEAASNIAKLVCVHGCAGVVEVALVKTSRNGIERQAEEKGTKSRKSKA